jgi:hypothetical protein
MMFYSCNTGILPNPFYNEAITLFRNDSMATIDTTAFEARIAQQAHDSSHKLSADPADVKMFNRLLNPGETVDQKTYEKLSRQYFHNTVMSGLKQGNERLKATLDDLYQ